MSFNAKYIGRIGLEILIPLAILVLAVLGIYSYTSTNLCSTQFTTTVTKTVTMYLPPTTITVTKIVKEETSPQPTSSTSLNSVTSATSTMVTVVYQYGYVVRYPNGSETFIPTTQYITTLPTPPTEFKGPIVNMSTPGLNATIILSKGEVKVGEQLWIKAIFRGEKASAVCFLFVDVVDSEGNAIRKIGIPPPKVPTPRPGIEVNPETDYVIREFRVDIPNNATTGRYIIAINVTTCSKEVLMSLKIPITVLPPEYEVVPTPPPGYIGPVAVNEVPGLKIYLFLSSDKVKIGDTLKILVYSVGEKAFCCGCPRFVTVVSSEGQVVYRTAYACTHITISPGSPPPQEDIRTISWKVSKDPNYNIDITPGIYTIIVETGVLTVNATVTVVS